jgi:hypothetical protein
MTTISNLSLEQLLDLKRSLTRACGDEVVQLETREALQFTRDDLQQASSCSKQNLCVSSPFLMKALGVV